MCWCICVHMYVCVFVHWCVCVFVQSAQSWLDLANYHHRVSARLRPLSSCSALNYSPRLLPRYATLWATRLPGKGIRVRVSLNVPRWLHTMHTMQCIGSQRISTCQRSKSSFRTSLHTGINFSQLVCYKCVTLLILPLLWFDTKCISAN